MAEQIPAPIRRRGVALEAVRGWSHGDGGNGRPAGGGPVGTTCSVCGTGLTVHERVRGGICGSAECRRVLAGRHAAQRSDVASTQLREAALALRGSVAEALRPRGDVLLAIVPSYENRIVNLPERRRRRFRDHLTSCITEAMVSGPPAKASGDGITAEHYGADLPDLAKACATCRGFCCRTGGDRAWIDANTVRRFMAGSPTLRPRDVLRVYLAHVPLRTFRYSCVYHGEQGCALPRVMRADICNTFECAGLQQLRRDLTVERPRNPAALLVVAGRGGVVMRSMVHLTGGA